MANPQLVKYIQDSLINKVSLEQIKKNLTGVGWPDAEINDAVNFFNQPVSFEKPNVKPEPVKSKKQVPALVKVLAIFGFIGTVLNVISGLILLLAGGLINMFLALVPSLASISAVLNEMSMIIGGSILGFAVLNFFMSRGLLKGQNWARILTVIFGFMAITGSIVGIVMLGINYYIYMGGSLFISLLITIYLVFSKKVKQAFK
ncbi:MAG TPA: hypothetical protein VMC80_00120 [Patescibacteria group bacterium]|nr:hypothetical protein [Patescibacteria group bacterium]